MKHNILDDYEYFVSNSHDLVGKLSRIEKDFKLKAKREHKHGHYLQGNKYDREAWTAELAVNAMKLIAMYSKEELNRMSDNSAAP